MGIKKKNGTGVVDIKSKRAFSVKEAAEATTLSKVYLYKQIQAGSIPATHFGKRVVILAEDLDAFIHRGLRTGTK